MNAQIPISLADNVVMGNVARGFLKEGEAAREKTSGNSPALVGPGGT